MRTLILAPVLAALTLALAAPLPAQEMAPTPVDTLARVRATQRFGVPRRVTGWVLAADTQSVTVTRWSGGEQVTVPVAELARLEVSHGRRSRGEGALRGAKRGLVGGLVVSAFAVGVTSLVGGGCGECFFTAGQLAALGGASLTVVTTVGGAILGAASPGDRWVQVRPPVQLRPVSAGGAAP